MSEESDSESHFRKEALEHHRSSMRGGDIVRLSPAWVRWVYLVVGGLVGAALLYSVVGRINEYALGPAVVRSLAKREITAIHSATVSQVLVTPGQKVTADEVLVRLHPSEELATLERLDREYEAQVVKMLRDPADQVARQALATLRAEREQARMKLEERTIRAPKPGVVSDVRIRAGQHLTPGEVLLSLVDDDARFEVVAMLPGHVRPLLVPGASLRLELEGYRYQYQQLWVESVGNEVVGPAEVRRFLGPELADVLVVEGPVVLVRASLPRAQFEADGRWLSFHDGMRGQAGARIRRTSVLVFLLPWLRGL